jgi:hypothetical protein
MATGGIVDHDKTSDRYYLPPEHAAMFTTPDDFHRQLIRVIAELSDAAGAFLVRAVHDEARGWQWASEPL